MIFHIHWLDLHLFFYYSLTLCLKALIYEHLLVITALRKLILII